MTTTVQRFGDRPAVAERAREITFDTAKNRSSVRLLPHYDITTYRQLWDRVQAAAAQLAGPGTAPVEAGERAAILGFASRDYVTVDLACNYLGVVVVPLQTSAAPDQLGLTMTEAEPRILLVSIEHLPAAVELAARTDSVTRVVVFDRLYRSTDHAETFAAAAHRLAEARGIALETLDALSGRTVEPPTPRGSPDETLAMLMYTSGSTGTPKGAMYTERLVGEMWGGAGWSEFFADDQAVTTLHYVPMSHVAGHSSVKGTLARGGVTHFSASSDLSTFIEDIRLTRPTEVSFVPRVCELLYQHYRTGSAGTGPHPDEAARLSRIRHDTLGGRIAWASCTSAPVSAEMKAFMEKLLGIELHILYGTTEIGGVLADGRFLRPPVIDYKLADVPELGYYRTDSPHPRGELLIKSESTVPGYYRQPELTAAVFDDEGFYRTGDIVAETAADRVAIIDRKSAVVKLSQGEFVALPSLESIYTAGSPLVHQMFLYANSERSFPVAVVVPAPGASARHTASGLESAILESFREVAAHKGLNSYEVPKAVLLEQTPFSTGNGLLSDHRKLLRPQATARYAPALEALYQKLADTSDQLLHELRTTGSDRPVLETLLRAVGVVVGDTSAGHDPQSIFRDLGGDSLSAVSLSQMLEEIYQVRVPVDVIISPSYTLHRLAGYISGKRGDTRQRPTVQSVHGEDGKVIRAADLTLAKFFDDADLAPGAVSGRHTPRPRTVLLTGASGYLGRFLCLEWLERLAAHGGKLICVVRGENAEAATARLRDSLSTDDSLRDHFDRLAAQHLEVLAGDMAEHQLGLPDADWVRLGTEVDLIVHAGALVNHVLQYSAMFESNVVGTAELIRLALTTRIKGFTYLSSVAVATADPLTGPLDEAADIRDVLPELPVEGSYAAGYAASKWAGEVLLHEAHDRYGLPVTVFRSSMILAHSTYRGQLNAPDVFSRLLHGIVRTGTAPASFYRVDAARAHYDGLPVDLTADVIATLGRNEDPGYRTFNLVNPNDDGVSLDVFVDWLIDRGYAIERIPDYQDWRQRFEQALRALPDQERRRSVLPLIHAFDTPEPAVPGSPVPSDLFEKALRSSSPDGIGTVPSLSADFIEKYVHDLEYLFGFTASRAL